MLRAAALAATLSLVGPHQPDNPFIVPIENIPQISCYNDHGGGELGTGIRVASDILITATHVTKGNLACYAYGKPAVTIEDEPGLDLTILRIDAPTNMTSPISCEGIKEGQVYLSVGYAQGYHLVVQPLIGGVGRANDGSVFSTLWTVSGFMYAGMSGGPVFDMAGRIVAINNASDQDGHSLVRPLSDIPALCPARIA